MPSDDQLLKDRIVYLASLASNRAEIDPMLDTLRSVTSGQNGPLLKQNDRQILTVLEQELKTYLITKEKVRHFTKDMLDTRLASYSKSSRGLTAKKVLGQLFIIIGLSVVSFIVGFFAFPGEPGVRATLASTLAEALLHGAVAWLFWTARHSLVAVLQKAYGLVALGLAVAAVGSAQFPLLSAYPHLATLPLLHYAGFLPPFLIMAALLYWAMYLFARQLGLPTARILRPYIVLPSAVIVAIAASLLPPAAEVSQSMFFDLSAVSITLTAFLSIITAVLSFDIGRAITRRYALGIRLFALAESVVALACVLFCVVLFTSGESVGEKISLLGLPFSISQLLFLASALILKRALED